jgi:hypothetical protein
MKLRIQEGFSSFVIPAKAGIQGNKAMNFLALDPRLRGDDEMGQTPQSRTASSTIGAHSLRQISRSGTLVLAWL